MATGQLFLKARYDNFQKQSVRDESNVMNIDNQNSKGSMTANGSPPQPPAIKNAKSSQKKKSGKKHSGKGGGDMFRVNGNNIKGNTAEKCGVFGFGNKYMGRKKQQEESSEDESDSSDEDDD